MGYHPVLAGVLPKVGMSTQAGQYIDTGARYGNPPSMSQDRDLTWPVSASFAIDGVCSGAGQGHASTVSPQVAPAAARPPVLPPAAGPASLPIYLPTYMPTYAEVSQPGNTNEQHGSLLVPACTVAPRYRRGHPSNRQSCAPPAARPTYLLLTSSSSSSSSSSATTTTTTTIFILLLLLSANLPTDLCLSVSLLRSLQSSACQIRISSCTPDPPSVLDLSPELSLIRPALCARERCQKKARLTLFGSLQPGSPPPPIFLSPAPLFSPLRPSAWEIRAPLTDRTQDATRSL
ncbi:hypothetical protein L249_7326, partial [Ophiocordyceps polyrhachis-furcata BCC 54312]